MAVVGWFLCFPAFFFILEKSFFFPVRDLRQKKVYATYTKKKISVEKKTRLTSKKKKLRDLRQKKNKKATYAYFHNRATLSSRGGGRATAHPLGLRGGGIRRGVRAVPHVVRRGCCMDGFRYFGGYVLLVPLLLPKTVPYTAEGTWTV